MKKLLLIILAMIVVASSVSEAQRRKRTSSTVRKEQQDIGKKVTQTSQLVSANKKELSRKLNELYSVNGEILRLDASISALEVKISQLGDSISSVEDEIALLGKDVETLKRSMGESLREARKQRQNMTDMGLLLSSKNFSEAMHRLSYLKQLDKSRARKTRQLQEQIKQLEEKRLQLQSLREQQKTAMASLSDRKQELSKRQLEMKELVAYLQSRGKELEKELRQRQNQVHALDSELDRLIAEEKRAEEERLRAEEEAKRKAQEEAARKAQEDEQRRLASEGAKNNDGVSSSTTAENLKNTGGSKSTTPSASATSADAPRRAVVASTFELSKGKLPSPVAGPSRVIGLFGRSRHAALARVEVDNPGIDLESQSGASALSVYDGVVSSIFYLDGYRNIVMVRHGDYITVYANLDRLSVKKGDKVKRGQALGKVYADPDDNGRSVLHFEVRKEKEKLNPLDWIATR